MSTAQINCPQCRTSFPAEAPQGEVHNGEQASVFVVAHHFTDNCPKCGRKFMVQIAQVACNFTWVEVKPKSPIVVPDGMLIKGRPS